MKNLSKIFFLFLIFTNQAWAQGEVALGIGISNVDFTTNFGQSYDYSSTNMHFALGAKLYLNLENILLGATIGQVYSDMNLDRNVSDGSDNTFKNLYYGAYLGFMLSESWRLDLEYYISTQFEIMYAQGRNANAFSKGDRLTGNGFGIGITKIIKSKFMIQMLGQMFLIDKAKIDGTKYNVDSDEFKNVSYPSVTVSFGYIF